MGIGPGLECRGKRGQTKAVWKFWERPKEADDMDRQETGRLSW